MNIQQTVHHFLINNPRSTVKAIMTGTGFTSAQVSRAIRTLVTLRLAERCSVPAGKPCAFKGVLAERRKNVKARILQLVQEHGAVTPAEICSLMGIPEDYARHSLRNLLDQHLLAREPVAGTKTWRYVPSNVSTTYGRSARMVELYSLLLPVQQARIAA